MPTHEQVIERLVVNDRLSVEGAAQLNDTTIHGTLAVGDALTKSTPPVRLFGDLTVDGSINGQLTDIIGQINKSTGIIAAERIDPRVVAFLRSRLAQAVLVSQAAIAIAIIAVVIAVVVLVR